MLPQIFNVARNTDGNTMAFHGSNKVHGDAKKGSSGPLSRRSDATWRQGCSKAATRQSEKQGSGEAGMDAVARCSSMHVARR